MKGKLPFILIGLIVLLAVGWLVVKPMLETKKRTQVSDVAGDVKVIYGQDDYYAGYTISHSPVMEQYLLESGYALQWGPDDKGLYDERLDKFNSGEVQVMHLPWSVYQTLGKGINWKGIGCFNVSVSHGSDAILAFKKDLLKGRTKPFEDYTLNELLDDSSLTCTFVGFDSPSDFLQELLQNDVRLPQLESSNRWKNEVETADEVMDALDDHKGELFILWEPYVTRALLEYPDELVVVWSSKNFDKYITDGMFFHEDLIAKDPDAVLAIMEAYFLANQTYMADPKRLRKDMADWLDLDEEVADSIMGNIRFQSFHDNAYTWFGLKDEFGRSSPQGMKNLILAINRILVKRGIMKPEDQVKSPSYIINSSFLEKLSESMIGSEGTRVQMDFASLTDNDWERMQHIKLNLPQINFGSGSSSLQATGNSAIDHIAELLAADGPYGNFPFEIWGCSGEPGKPGIELSQDRADMVMQQFRNVYRFPEERMRAVGKGNTVPSKGLSDTRVEIHLLRPL